MESEPGPTARQRVVDILATSLVASVVTLGVWGAGAPEWGCLMTWCLVYFQVKDR